MEHIGLAASSLLPTDGSRSLSIVSASAADTSKCSELQATKLAKALYNQFRSADADGPDVFLAGTVRIFMHYRLDVVMRAVDPMTGIPGTRHSRCREYIGRLRKSGKDVALFDYAGAKHSFDNPDLAGRPLMFDVVNSGKCTWVERDGQIVDAETGSPASMKDPCIIAKGTFGYSADAQSQAVADVRIFLSELFRLR